MRDLNGTKTALRCVLASRYAGRPNRRRRNSYFRQVFSSQSLIVRVTVGLSCCYRWCPRNEGSAIGQGSSNPGCNGGDQQEQYRMYGETAIRTWRTTGVSVPVVKGRSSDSSVGQAEPCVETCEPPDHGNSLGWRRGCRRGIGKNGSTDPTTELEPARRPCLFTLRRRRDQVSEVLLQALSSNF